jgi:hypothetical protein
MKEELAQLTEASKAPIMKQKERTCTDGLSEISSMLNTCSKMDGT